MRCLIVHVLFFLYNALLVWLAVLPASDASMLVPPIDKLAHAAAYGVLFIITFKEFKRWWKGRRLLWLSFIYAVLLGLFTEILQYHVATRSFSFSDWIADIVGVSLLAILMFPKTNEN